MTTYQPCPAPSTDYVDADGTMTVRRDQVIALLGTSVEWHESCDPADVTCPYAALRALLRDTIRAGHTVAAAGAAEPVDDVVFVDAWPVFAGGGWERFAGPDAHVHLRADGRCVQRPGGELCNGGTA